MFGEIGEMCAGGGGGGAGRRVMFSEVGLGGRSVHDLISVVLWTCIAR